MTAKVPGSSRDAATPQLFLRNATGLVKGWSRFDAFVYSHISVNSVASGRETTTPIANRMIRDGDGLSSNGESPLACERFSELAWSDFELSSCSRRAWALVELAEVGVRSRKGEAASDALLQLDARCAGRGS
jgi:hypothetical protein